MRGLVVALVVLGCKGGGDSDPPTPVPAEFGLDARPENPSCVAPPARLVEEAEISDTRVFASVALSDPLGVYQAPGDADHWYAIEQGGRVKRFDGTEASPTATTVLNISASIVSGGESGLLGMAFHPDFQSNGTVFLSYTTGNLVTRVSRIQTTDNGATWDQGSLTEVLSVDQPFGNHNGGHIEFGPDGMLYWGLGDGGSAGDPGNRAQNLNSLLGKILRIDVDSPPYVVPPDNPFYDHPTARKEIYAFGLRNPWRFSFDRANGELWLGDVGQNAIEEVDRIEAGGNYGWRIREGSECYATTPCDGNGLIDPVVEYAQDPGFSVMGGVVYRGTAIPELVGTYLFSDHYHGRIMAVVYDAVTGEPARRRLLDTGRAVVHFAQDAAGEVYYVDRSSGGIFRLDPLAPSNPPDFPTTLSASGCFDPADPGTALPPMIPYDLNHPFWSDGASKRRWMAIPDGTTITVDPAGDLHFPVGTVLGKEFTVADQRVETRLFMHHTEGEWAGYSYRWRADGTDADLVRAGEVVNVGAQSWEIPSRASCMQCHTEVAGRSLGLELPQLERDVVYPSTNRLAPQLATLQHIGMFAEPPADPEPFPAIADEAAPLDVRARTYLHVNCAQCHQPDGPGRGNLDLRVTTGLAETGLCAEPVEGGLGIQDARIVAPGEPDRSVLSRRLRDAGAYRMPPIATHVIDSVGADAIDAWIQSLATCP